MGKAKVNKRTSKRDYARIYEEKARLMRANRWKNNISQTLETKVPLNEPPPLSRPLEQGGEILIESELQILDLDDQSIIPSASQNVKRLPKPLKRSRVTSIKIASTALVTTQQSTKPSDETLREDTSLKFSGQVKFEPPSSDDGSRDPIPDEEKNYETMMEVKAEPKEETEVVVKEEMFEFHEHPPERQIEDYKTLYFKLKQEISNLETENQRLTEENQMLNEKLQNFTNKVEKILQKHEKDKVKNDSESVKDIESVIIKNLKIDNRNLAEQNKSLAMKIDEVIKQNHIQMKEIQELTEKNKSLSDEIQEVMVKNRNLSVRIQECKYCTQHFASLIQSVEIERDSGQVEDGNTLVRDVQSLTEDARRLEEENEQHQIVLYPVSSGLTIEVMTDDKINQVVKENRKRKR